LKEIIQTVELLTTIFYLCQIINVFLYKVSEFSNHKSLLTVISAGIR